MKYDQLRSFEKHLEGASPNHFSNLYCILSKDDGERKIGVDAVLRSLLAGQKRELCLFTFDGEDANTEALLSELNTSSFLTERKVVLIQNGDKLKKAAMEAIQAYFMHPRKSHYLVIAAATINRNTLFYKNAEKQGVILDFAEAKPWEKEKTLSEWIVQQTVVFGKKMTLQAAQYLVKQVGLDPLLLQQELHKVVCYVGDRADITLQDIGTICISVNLETVWQLGEALFCRNAPAALHMVQAQLASGAVFPVLLRQIRNQFQTEYQICSILTNGGHPQDVAAEFPYMKGNILEKHLQMALGYGMDGFKRAMLAIDEADIAAKNSMIDTVFLAERLVIQLTTF